MASISPKGIRQPNLLKNRYNKVQQPLLLILAILVLSRHAAPVYALPSRIPHPQRQYAIIPPESTRRNRAKARALLNAALLETRGGGPWNRRKPKAEEATKSDDDGKPDEKGSASAEDGEGDVKVEVTEEDQAEGTEVVNDEDKNVDEEVDESSLPAEPLIDSEIEQQEQDEEISTEETTSAADDNPTNEGSATEPNLSSPIFEEEEINELPLNEEIEQEPVNDGSIATALEEASQLRQEGKASHDAGNFAEAANQFSQAANLLEACFGLEPSTNEEEEDETETSEERLQLQDEWATCRLHESLCHLKAENYESCIDACSSLLEFEEFEPGPMIRARALHRRARAKVALENIDGAIEDARDAAYIGDRKAVTYYGKLLRETGREQPPASFMPPSLSDTSQASLFESLLNKSPPSSDGSNSMNDIFSSSPLGFLGNSFLSQPGGLGGGAGGGMGSLAKSLLKKASKKLEDESTHEDICKYLKNTNPSQIQTYASMAGLSISTNQATQLTSFAHGVTPRTIRRTVKTTKRAIWGVQLIRKTMALISKYRNLLILLVILQWTKSAVFRPIPVPKVKVKAPRGAPRGGAAPQQTAAPTVATPTTPATPGTTTTTAATTGNGNNAQTAPPKTKTTEARATLQGLLGGGDRLAALAADR